MPGLDTTMSTSNSNGNCNPGIAPISDNASGADSLGLRLNLALPPTSDKNSATTTTTTIADVLGSTNQVNTAATNPTTSLLDDQNATTLAPSASSLNINTPGSTTSTRHDSVSKPSILHQISSGSSSTVPSSSHSAITSVQVCQRLDEVSARLIGMEEVVNKLCYKIDEQNSTINDLKVENESCMKKILGEMKQINAHIPLIENPEENEKDGFVTDLLNSITNVSTNYLKKINNKNSQKFKKQRLIMSTSDLPNLNKQQQLNAVQQSSLTPLQNRLPQYQQRAMSSEHLSNFLKEQSTFTLNPNGIKKRKGNNLLNRGALQSSTSSLKNSHQNSAFTSNYSTESLPNISLDHLAKQSSRTAFTPQQHSQLRDFGQPAPIHLNPANTSSGSLPNYSRQHRSINIQIGTDNENDDRDDYYEEDGEEDGYQEDDEDKRKSSELDDDEDEEISVDNEEEDEVDDYAYRELFDLSGRQQTLLQPQSRFHSQPHLTKHQRSYHDPTQESLHPNGDSKSSKKRKKAVDDSLKKFAMSSSQVSVRATPTSDERLVLKNSDNQGGYVPNRKRDLNYTILKAPYSVRTIWEEYVSGIDGNPPIKYLEEIYGNKWRVKKNAKTFARRKRLYKFILNGIEKGKSAEEMIDTLEKRRLYRNENGEVKKRTIGWLQQSLIGI